MYYTSGHSRPFLTKEEMRFLLYLVQFGQCIWCGGMMSFNRKKTGEPARDFCSFEHVIPHRNGGKNDLSNLVLSHTKCNHERERVQFQKAKDKKVAARLKAAAHKYHHA